MLTLTSTHRAGSAWQQRRGHGHAASVHVRRSGREVDGPCMDNPHGAGEMPGKFYSFQIWLTAEAQFAIQLPTVYVYDVAFLALF